MPKRSSSPSSEADGLHARKKAKLSKTPTTSSLQVQAQAKRPQRSAVATSAIANTGSDGLMDERRPLGGSFGSSGGNAPNRNMLRRLRGAASSLNGPPNHPPRAGGGEHNSGTLEEDEGRDKLEQNCRRRLPSNTDYCARHGAWRVMASLLLVLLLRNLLVITWQRSHSSQLAMKCNIDIDLLNLDFEGSKRRQAQAKRELDWFQSASEYELDTVDRVEWIRRLRILEEERNATRSEFQALMSNFDLGVLE